MLHRREQHTSSTRTTLIWSHVSGCLTGAGLCVALQSDLTQLCRRQHAPHHSTSDSARVTRRAACSNACCNCAHGYAHDNTEVANTSCQSWEHLPNGPRDVVGTSGIHWTLEARLVASRDMQTWALFTCQPEEGNRCYCT